jgi:hypothetical protein
MPLNLRLRGEFFILYSVVTSRKEICSTILTIRQYHNYSLKI